MPKQIQLEPIDHEVSVKTNENLLSMLLQQELNVNWSCGGRGRCSTCHVYIQSGTESLSPKSKRELKTLELLSNCQDNSRLACQARVLGEGVVVELPAGMYLSEIEDLDALIGKRVQQPILHPLNGTVLVEGGLMITRSIVSQLEEALVQIDQLLARS
ncbi:2Fe-2S iron-sulfur cluster-binding protein [Acaryochloris marina]|uniref:Fe-S cluster-binding protein, possible ferredoxin n=1 Tax=Acaryochloris marina (strain MBIC 11017) TaxID=329726 RepID=B0C0F8_ACAM1|nr:2Fe-2S iron-sulfur cluster-binding protein [Acaryochloris marina]ABW30751.1 Fe-S cluster-binding protein, possible ferredoxin [Acaryochloris marina MBIC11017]BDM79526.1 ferredoxin [Acaryochloris marina MBIC10699]